jgi:hypothetical protein
MHQSLCLGIVTAPSSSLSPALICFFLLRCFYFLFFSRLLGTSSYNGFCDPNRSCGLFVVWTTSIHLFVYEKYINPLNTPIYLFPFVGGLFPPLLSQLTVLITEVAFLHGKDGDARPGTSHWSMAFSKEATKSHSGDTTFNFLYCHLGSLHSIIFWCYVR